MTEDEEPITGEVDLLSEEETTVSLEFVYGTAGLSSANQLVSSTGAETYDPANTSAASPIVGVVLLEALPLSPKSFRVASKTDFATALRESLLKNRELIRELAKY